MCVKICPFGVRVGERGCMYMKDWFKPVFPLFLTWLASKLKILIPMADPPPMCYWPNYSYGPTVSDTLYGHCSLKDPPWAHWNSDSRTAKAYFHIPVVEDTHVLEETGNPNRLSLDSEEASKHTVSVHVVAGVLEVSVPLALMAATSITCVHRISLRFL